MKFRDAVINVKGLYYKEILKNITFTIQRGEYVAVIGPNGGGKSTLMKLLLGLIVPTKGDISIFGQKEGYSKDGKIGYVAQQASQIDRNFPITVGEVVNLGAKSKYSLFGLKKDAQASHVEQIMEKMGIAELKNRRIAELSGGQIQRVMIARALVSKPQILILDEPNTGVDTHSQRKFYELLKKLNQEENITILFVTHDLGVIADDVNSVLCINQTLLSCHNPHEILSCSEMSKLYGIDAHLVCHHH